MTTIAENMSADHRRCDEIFAEAEGLIDRDDWSRGAPIFINFRDGMEHHFSMEESVLFPSFEERVGQTMGPTQMMRMEHTQMRQLFTDMAQAVEQRDRERYLGLSETLMMIMQQHNMKEEQMLYRMIDQAFGPESGELIEKMSQVE